MMRYFLLIAIAGLASSAVADDNTPTWHTDRQEPKSHSTLFSDVGFADVVPAGEEPDETDIASALRAAFFLEDAPSGDLKEDDEADTIARPFRPACDCKSRVPSLDHWCVCDVAHGRTDQTGHHPCEWSHGTCHLLENGKWVCNDAYCDVWGPPVHPASAAVRFGWWAVGTDGSRTKTGEFQLLESSPFWDIDLIHSDGVRTWDVTVSSFDDEADAARLYYYGPLMSARFDFQRYFRHLDHKPLVGSPADVPPGLDDRVVVEDLNVGEDYAIRVQELKARFQGPLTDNLKWRLNVWSQRKFGERQANSMAHCFNVHADDPPGTFGNVCHVLSQRQSIDWLTVEVQPVLEAKFQDVTVEYSRTMRGFGQDDEAVFRQYTRTPFSPANNILGPPYQYALVPENFTQIDRLKVNARLTEHNQLYANLFVGDTKNKFREMRRSFGGYDLRLINSSFEQVKLTAYTSWYDETNELPSVILDAPPLAPSAAFDEGALRHPVDYTRTRAGVKGSWQPFGVRGPRYSNYGLWEGTSLASGYEYYLLERDHATYPTRLQPFTQPDTKSHQIEFGPSTRWSRSLDTYVRYKVRFIEDPLIGVRPNSGDLNTNLPEQVHATEIGGTWAPAANFTTTAQFSFINSWHRSEFADFREDSYPMVFSAWYAPMHRLSLTAGYAFFSNWIDQDITLGATLPTVPVPPLRTETTRWSYTGKNHLVSFNANYAWAPGVQLVGAIEWNRGTNEHDVPPSPAGADWSALPWIMHVVVETTRFTTGVDWQPFHHTNLYARYIFFDFDDIGAGIDSGTAHMVLAGATRTW